MNVKASYRDQIQLILLSILPAALVSGPLISEIIVNLIVIFFIIETLIEKKFSFLKEKLFLYFTLFYFFLIFSLLNSDIFSKSALNIFSYFRFFLFAFAVRALFQRQGSINKYIYYVLSITIFIIVIDGYIQFFSGQNILGFPKYRVDRLSGFFNDDLILGSYLLRIIPILLTAMVFVGSAGESFAPPPCLKNTDAYLDNYFGTKTYAGGNKHVDGNKYVGRNK